MQVGQVVFAKNENDLLKLCSEISIRFLGDSSNIISVYYYFFFFLFNVGQPRNNTAHLFLQIEKKLSFEIVQVISDYLSSSLIFPEGL